jgi:hypothetical protein
VLDKDAPLQQIYNEIIRRSLVHKDDIAQQFVMQWVTYRDLINRSNLQLIKDKQSIMDGFYDKFINSITFNNALNNSLYYGSRYNPEFNTLIVGKPLVPIQRKRPREAVDDRVDTAEIKKYVHLLFIQAMFKAHINEMDYFVRSSLDPFISDCLRALGDTRTSITQFQVSTEEKGEEDMLLTLSSMLGDTVTQWKAAFGEADPEDKETQVALSKARDDADKLSAQHLELLVKDTKATEYLGDYEVDIATRECNKIIQMLVDILQSCRSAHAEIKAPILLDYRKPGTGKRQRVKEESKESEMEWLSQSQTKLQAKMLEFVTQSPPRSYLEARKSARTSALMLDYAEHLRKFDFSNPTTLIASMAKAQIVPTYVNWIVEHEAKARSKAMEGINDVRRQTILACDLTSGRVASIRDYYTQQIEASKKSRQAVDAELQLSIRGTWKYAPVETKDKGSLIQLFAEHKQREDRIVSPASKQGVEDLIKLNITGNTINELQTSIQSVLLGLAVLTLVN